MGKEMKICVGYFVFVCVIVTYLNSVLMDMNFFGGKNKSLPKMNAKPKFESVVMQLNCKTCSSVVVVLVFIYRNMHSCSSGAKIVESLSKYIVLLQSVVALTFLIMFCFCVKVPS